MNLIKKMVSSLLGSILVIINSAYAALPDVQDPSQGRGSGYFDTIRGYIYDGAIVVGLVFCSAALLVVAKNSITEFSNIGDGRGTWTKFGAFVVIGIVLIVAVIWLVSNSIDTLASS